jgi:hypothetical protein
MAWPDHAKAVSQICNAPSEKHSFGTYAQSAPGLFTGIMALSFHGARAVKTRETEIITSSPKIAFSDLRIGLLFEKSQRQG